MIMNHVRRDRPKISSSGASSGREMRYSVQRLRRRNEREIDEPDRRYRQDHREGLPAHGPSERDRCNEHDTQGHQAAA
jgi:hypothetical protein